MKRKNKRTRQGNTSEFGGTGFVKEVIKATKPVTEAGKKILKDFNDFMAGNKSEELLRTEGKTIKEKTENLVYPFSKPENLRLIKCNFCGAIGSLYEDGGVLSCKQCGGMHIR